jgi:hypothetical protein
MLDAATEINETQPKRLLSLMDRRDGIVYEGLTW